MQKIVIACSEIEPASCPVCLKHYAQREQIGLTIETFTWAVNLDRETLGRAQLYPQV